MDPAITLAMGNVKRAAHEFYYQWSWAQTNHRQNVTLMYARLWLEIFCAIYVVERKKVQR